MRNALVREFNNTCGLDYACKFEFVDVYADGKYRGNYLLCTPIDIEETRVNIDKKKDAILEIEASFSEGDFYINSGSSPFFNMRFQIAEGNELSGEGYSRVFSTIYQIEYAIISGDWDEIKKYADIDSLVRYYILVDYFKDVDFNWDSTRFYIEDGKLHGGPAWDYDRAVGQANSGRKNYYNIPDFTNGIYGDSTTGEWANSCFIGYPNENWQYTLSDTDWITTDDKSSHINHTWLTYLYQLSPKFREIISAYLIDLKDEMTLMYADTVDELGNVKTNAIDVIYNNEGIYNSFDRDANIAEDPTKPNDKRGILAKNDEGIPNTNFQSRKEAVDYLRKWLKERHQWMINHYASKELAEYCSNLSDKMLFDVNENAYAKNTTTSLTCENGAYTYTVNITVNSAGAAEALAEIIYNQVRKIFVNNLSYANVVVNTLVGDEVIATYSNENVYNDTCELVAVEITKVSKADYEVVTTVEFEVVDGIAVANVKVNIKKSNNLNYDATCSIYSKEHQQTVTELIKKYFSNSNIYISVNVEYYVDGSETPNYKFTNVWER